MQLRSKAILIVTLTFWLVHCAVFTLSNALENNPNLLQLSVARVIVSGVGVAFCYAILFLLRKLPTRRLAFKIAALAIVAPVAGESFAWIAYFAFQIATNKPISLVVNWSSALLILAMYTWLFFAWASLILSIEYSFDLREEERQNSHFRSLAQEAKLSALQAQINPHFLFNSLNSLSALILDRKIEAAEEMVSRLAQFFRLNLTTNALEDTPLENEIKMQREYLAIEQVRYPNLKVMIDVDDSIREVMVPPLILQPLVENAVKYGAVKAGSSPDILISATPLKDGQLRILVENECADNCQSHRAPGTGLGLRYVRERLQSRFGDKFDMGILRSPNNKFSVSIRIPSSI